MPRDRCAHSASTDRAELCAALLVVVEHVVAGAGRREQHRVARLGEARRRSRAPRQRSPPRTTGTASARSASTQRRGLAVGHDGAAAAAQAAAPAAGTTLPCGAHPSSRTYGRSSALERHRRRGDVGGLAVVDPEHAVHLPDRLQPVRQRAKRPKPLGDRLEAARRPSAPRARQPARWPRCDRPAAGAPAAAGSAHRRASSCPASRSYQASAVPWTEKR